MNKWQGLLVQCAHSGHFLRAFHKHMGMLV